MAANTKSWIKSRTIWLAIVQAVIGISLIVVVPEQREVGAALLLKSLIDLGLRVDTKTPVV